MPKDHARKDANRRRRRRTAASYTSVNAKTLHRHPTVESPIRLAELSTTRESAELAAHLLAARAAQCAPCQTSLTAALQHTDAALLDALDHQQRDRSEPQPWDGSQQPAPPDAATEFLHRRLAEALEESGGDRDAARAALERTKTVIADAMRLLQLTRVGARLPLICYPPLPHLFDRAHQPADGSLVWQRPKREQHWQQQLPPGQHEVAVLDVNAPYLAALNTALPLSTSTVIVEGPHRYDRRRTVMAQITAPAWPHNGLPSPLGRAALEDTGPMWVPAAVLRAYEHAAAAGLCKRPQIHAVCEGSMTDVLLRGFARVLRQARRTALDTQDEVLLAYVRAIYMKFIATMGHSHLNRELDRPDWQLLIWQQADTIRWMTALKAHRAGLTIVRFDSEGLHVIGDWRTVLASGDDAGRVRLVRHYLANFADQDGENPPNNTPPGRPG
ncbi:hypothetical protein [Streptomyces sp. NPDC050988]|uniref:hypothetical protein n=1 Tax=Streptomyces sp. NPDC050988 TaxID=3365637 RepID=UPI00379AA03A